MFTDAQGDKVTSLVSISYEQVFHFDVIRWYDMIKSSSLLVWNKCVPEIWYANVNLSKTIGMVFV